MKTRHAMICVCLALFPATYVFATCAASDEPLVNVIAHSPLRYFDVEEVTGNLKFSCTLVIDATETPKNEDINLIQKDCVNYIHEHLWYRAGCPDKNIWKGPGLELEVSKVPGRINNSEVKHDELEIIKNINASDI